MDATYGIRRGFKRLLSISGIFRRERYVSLVVRAIWSLSELLHANRTSLVHLAAGVGKHKVKLQQHSICYKLLE